MQSIAYSFIACCYTRYEICCIIFLYFCSEALQQVNVLVDTISVLKTPYMEALTVADAFDVQHNMQDVVQQSKQFQWVTRRKALSEAVGVLEQAQKFRSKLLTETDPDKAMFFHELEKMRELWRVRKTGNVTYGDLGYKMC